MNAIVVLPTAYFVAFASQEEYYRSHQVPRIIRHPPTNTTRIIIRNPMEIRARINMKIKLHKDQKTIIKDVSLSKTFQTVGKSLIPRSSKD